MIQDILIRQLLGVLQFVMCKRIEFSSEIRYRICSPRLFVLCIGYIFRRSFCTATGSNSVAICGHSGPCAYSDGIHPRRAFGRRCVVSCSSLYSYVTPIATGYPSVHLRPSFCVVVSSFLLDDMSVNRARRVLLQVVADTIL